MKTSYKKESGILSLVLDYVMKNVFRVEEVYTLMFLFIFVCFFYSWITYPIEELMIASSLLSAESLKICMWVSALLAIVSHLMPKDSTSKSNKGATGGPIRSYYELNDKLRQSLMTAINLDQ